MGLWDLCLAAVEAFVGKRDEVEKSDSILAMEKALLQLICASIGKIVQYFKGQIMKYYTFSIIICSFFGLHSAADAG